jgi:hypothetical protein
VQNGVFSDYDNTITVGKALENNSILKGGKWEAVNMDGRDYVTYTVQLTGAKVQELLPEALSSANGNYKNKPNLGSATEFRSALYSQRRVSGYAETLAGITSMTAEEIIQATDIITAKLKAYDERPTQPDFHNFRDIPGMIDPYLIPLLETQAYYGKIYQLVSHVYDSGELKLEIENGMFTGRTKSSFDIGFRDPE